MKSMSSECSLSVTTIYALSDEELTLDDDKRDQLHHKIELEEDKQNDLQNEIKREDTEHYKIFDKIFNLFVMCESFFGVELSYSWAPQILWWINCSVIAFAWVCFFYTQVIRLSDDLMGVLQVIALYGFGATVAMNMLFHKRYAKHFVSLIFAMREICLKNVHGSRADILKSNLSTTYFLLILYVMCGSSSCGLFTFAPVKEYIDNHKLTALIPIEIVFVDQSTNFGFAVANLVMSSFGLHGTLNHILYGALFIFIVFNFSTQVELVSLDFQYIDEMWANDNTIPKAYKEAYLKNVYKEIQDLKNYMDVLQLIYEKTLFYFFCFNYLSLIVCLFEVKQHNWIPGYGMTIGIGLQMMFFSLMGTKITITLERLCSIICDTKWYMYDLQSQRIILSMLHRCQSFEGLQLGPIGPLDIVTFITIVKSIYSYYTILSELF